MMKRRLRLDNRFRIIATRAINPLIAESIEVSEHTVKVFLRDRIVLVIVALRAGHRESQKRFRSRLHSVHRIVGQILQFYGPTLCGNHMIAIEPSSHDLRFGRIRKQVSR